MSKEFEDWRGTEEMEALYTMPEASEAIMATIINIGEVSKDKPILVGCSDDRAMTEESIAALVASGLPAERPYLRIFGGKYGAANILLASSIAQHGAEQTSLTLGDSYLDVAEDLSRRASELGIIMATHSDEAAEGDSGKLDTQTQAKLACAKAANLGAINQISEKEQLAIRVGETDSEALLGDGFDSDSFGTIPEAVTQVSQAYFGEQPQTFAVTRDEVLASSTPAMVLKGKHAATDRVKHVFNVTPDKVSDTGEAISRGVLYYHTDLVPMAEIIMRCYPELDLDPKILMQTIILDASATRMALSKLDGEADPSRLEAVRCGNADAALDHLYEVRQSLS